jgi:hypothetical protein
VVAFEEKEQNLQKVCEDITISAKLFCFEANTRPPPQTVEIMKALFKNTPYR